MSKRNRTPDFDADDDESGVEIDLSVKPARKFAGNDDQLKDADTGENVFDDITPALRKVRGPAEDRDEDLDDEDETEDQDEETTEDDEAVVADEDEEEEQPRPRGSKWQARLQREQRAKREAREDASAARDEVKDLRSRLDRIEQGQQLATVEREHNANVAKLQTKLNSLTADLKTAKEAGDTDREIELTNQMTDARVELRAAAIVFENQKAAAKTAATTTSSATNSDVVVVRKVNAWKRKHSRYKSDKAFAGFVNGVDKELVEEGLDPETDEYYEELDKRVKKRYPEEYRGAREEPRTRRRAPGQVEGRNSAPTRAAKPGANFQRAGNKVTLTARQVRNMRQFGLDPENANDVRDYVRENS